MHKTKWMEIAHLFYRCEGCCIQCQACGIKPQEDVECDASQIRIHEIIVNFKEGGD